MNNDKAYSSLCAAFNVEGSDGFGKNKLDTYD